MNLLMLKEDFEFNQICYAVHSYDKRDENCALIHHLYRRMERAMSDDFLRKKESNPHTQQ